MYISSRFMYGCIQETQFNNIIKLCNNSNRVNGRQMRKTYPLVIRGKIPRTCVCN